jgi:hypothetical protein
MAHFEVFRHLSVKAGVNSWKYVTMIDLLNRDWNLGPPECDAGVPHTVPRERTM